LNTLVRRAVAGYDGMIAGLAVLGGVALGLMALWITYDVVARYIFRAPTEWAGDLAEYTLLWTTFLGSPWLIRRNGHIMVELVVDRLPHRLRDGVLRVGWCAAAVAAGIFAYQSGIKTLAFYDAGRMVSRSWEVPLFAPYLAMPLGAALMAIECLRMAAARTETRQDLMLS
jgi:TRAP-type C4-dicarboxylate transport system permease small subunit